MASESQYRRDPAAEKLIRGINVSVFQRPKHEVAEEAVDNQSTRPNHKAMTDLTRQEVDAKLAQNRAEVDARLANFDTSIRTGFADLRAEFASLRTEIADGRTDAAKQSHDSIKWVIGTVFTTISIGVALIGLFINLSKSDKSPAVPPAQPAPIVITVPSAAQASPTAIPQTTK